MAKKKEDCQSEPTVTSTPVIVRLAGVSQHSPNTLTPFSCLEAIRLDEPQLWNP